MPETAETKNWVDYPLVDEADQTDTVLVGTEAGTGKRIPISSIAPTTRDVLHMTPDAEEPEAPEDGMIWRDGEDLRHRLGELTASFVFDTKNQTLTNKVLNLAYNTVAGNKAQFNEALLDGNFLFSGDAISIDNVTGLTSALAGKAATSALSTKADLVGGKIPENQLPAIAITDTFVVATQAAMLALTAEVGDIAIRSDQNKSYVLRASPASTLANWSELLSPTSYVTSVAMNGGTTGLSVSGGPITGSGTFQLGGTLVAANGGTGQSSYAIGNLLYASSANQLSKLAIGGSGSILSSNGTIPAWLGSSGTGNVARVGTPTYTTTIGVGGAAAATSGAGVTFPATASPSSNPNTLDDYREGTWAPTVTTTAGTITSYAAEGHYTKIGRMVTLTVAINITNNGSGSGGIAFTLPFTAATGPIALGSGRENWVTGSMLQVMIGSGATTASVLTYNNNYPGGTGHSLVLTITYFV